MNIIVLNGVVQKTDGVEHVELQCKMEYRNVHEIYHMLSNGT